MNLIDEQVRFYLTHEPLSAIIVVFKLFYQPFKSQLLGTECVFSHQDLRIPDLKLSKHGSFSPT